MYYVKDGIVYKVFNIELDMKEPVYVGKKLYQDIAQRLMDHEIATAQPIINEFPGDENITNLVVHVGSKENPENVRLANVKKALEGLLEDYPCYTGIRILLSK
jgi:hypothetical protein